MDPIKHSAAEELCQEVRSGGKVMCNRRGEDSRQTCYDIQLCTLIQS